jgi:hypothetical protein
VRRAKIKIGRQKRRFITEMYRNNTYKNETIR